jgi:hypothetical protein
MFQTAQQNVSLHLQNIFAEAELQVRATHKEILSVRREENAKSKEAERARDSNPCRQNIARIG